MRGRWPAGLECIDKLQGAMNDKERAKAILNVVAGDGRVLEACARLDIGETRFQQLRDSFLQAGLRAIAPRPAGRPRRAEASQAEPMRVLQERVQELERALHEAEVREEIALVLPNLQRTAGDRACATATRVEKKMRLPRVKIRKSR
jgi:hypothetical protein